jgi:hypothetical protein
MNTIEELKKDIAKAKRYINKITASESLNPRYKAQLIGYWQFIIDHLKHFTNRMETPKRYSSKES